MFRGPTAGPLFRSRGNRGKTRDGRLGTRSLLRIVRVLGQKIGLHVWCHGLRHTSITTAIERGQQAGVGHRLVEVFGDRQRVPDCGAVVPQARHQDR